MLLLDKHDHLYNMTDNMTHRFPI